MIINKITVVDISTSHITKQDDEKLKELVNSGSPAWVAPFCWGTTQYGWWIHIEGAREDYLEDLGLSPAFSELIEALHLHGFEYLRLDRDAEVCKAFPTFAW